MSPGSVGHTQDADFSGGPRVSIDGEAGTRLMRRCDDSYIVGLAELHEKLNDQITRNPKQVGQANPAQICDKIIPKLHPRFHTPSLWIVYQTRGKKGRWDLQKKGRRPTGR